MRSRRLLSDHANMLDLARRSDLLAFSCTGSPPERYVVTYRCKGLIWVPGHTAPSISTQHQLSIYLHTSYPRLPPALKWLTPIFHPNILPPHKNGGVCIGGWSPSETLADLCLRIGEMIQYKNYRVDDPLDIEAAEWARQHRHLFPVDDRELLRPVTPLIITPNVLGGKFR